MNNTWMTNVLKSIAGKNLPDNSKDTTKTAQQKLDNLKLEWDGNDVETKIKEDIDVFDHNQGGLIHRDRLKDLYWLARACGERYVYMVTPPGKVGESTEPFYIGMGDTKLIIAPVQAVLEREYEIEV